MSAKRKNDSGKAVVNSTADTLKQNIADSVIGYIKGVDSDDLYTRAVTAFRRETSVVLCIDSPLHSLFGTYRQESVKTFIVKILLFIGVSPNGNALAVLARLIEMFTVNPELSLEEVITDFAATHQTNVDAVTRIIEKNFSVYNNYFYDRVVLLTKSHPMTPKDVLCDISVFVRLKYASIKVG